MPIAIIPMTDEFKWDMHGQGWVLSCFAVGYMSSQVGTLKSFRVRISDVLSLVRNSYLNHVILPSLPLSRDNSLFVVLDTKSNDVKVQSK